MKMTLKASLSVWCLLACAMSGSGIAAAEEGATATEPPAGQEAPAATPTETAPPEATQPAPAQPAPEAEAQAQPQQAGGAPTGRTPTVPDSVVRLGRVEMVLIENQDAESALEFGQELLREDGDSARLRVLLAACLLRLDRPADALEQLNRAAEMSRDDAALQLHVLYNIARAYHAAGQLRQAATAYDRYVAFARSHQQLPSFVADAERLARVLRTRAEAASAD